MIDPQNTKIVTIGFAEAKIDAGSLTTAAIDTKGFDYCQVFVRVGTTDIGVTVLKIQDCATSGGQYADVTGLIWGTSANIAGDTSTLPADDSDGSWFIFDIDCRKTDRYLDLVATNGDGTAGGFLSAFAVLSRAELTPVTASERGAAEILRI